MINGRPTKLTPEVREEVCQAIRAGNYLETAAAYAGITRETFYDWMRKGRAQKSGAHVDFVDAVEKALADAEMFALQTITNANEWQAAAWRLERRYPERWRKRETTEHTGKLEVEQTTKIVIGEDEEQKVE
jgi:hypothetical protein